MRRLVIVSAVALAWASSTAVAAPTQFAQFTNNGANDAANGFRWTNYDNFVTTFDTVNGGAAVDFTFTNVPGLSAQLQGPQAARIRFDTGSNVSGQELFGQLNQPLTAPISILIIRDTQADTGNNNRQNLLTVTVTPASSTALLSGQNGSASLNASSPGQIITFSSDFYDFSNVTASGMGITFSGILPGLSFSTESGRSMLNSFTAAGVGSFTADLTAVPEPGSLALMGISGLVLCGVRFRGTRRKP
ncbi:PEP-CTERM sorting domain-containing protein [Singulisphaera sp. Ch08]|uniref:PEP-CTERM sorting domain-containing protein n=1 Tax=Singulisphaera sp. Ch08 TaxID=3120278 RepID=A0AAU7CFN5_9BACT